MFVSDLARAVQTAELAELAFGDRGIPIDADARLRECDYGAGNGMPVTELAAQRSRHIDLPWPGGQSYRQVVAQVGEFLDDLGAGLGRAHGRADRPLRHQVGAGLPARRGGAGRPR